ncbi:MAG: AbrB/MazE/SpoVT family DNA-binding domain-containing protein [Desulfobulbaceae bacterium]|nr:AbrB/MazE/SpoVT family DNA-binding domain-containing protein [Desulfobulbaceae bacterium]
MQTVITSKFQTTIPKAIREKLKLSVNDTLDWQVRSGKIVVEPLHKKILLHRNSIKTGPGNIEDDISMAKQLRATKT